MKKEKVPRVMIVIHQNIVDQVYSDIPLKVITQNFDLMTYRSIKPILSGYSSLIAAELDKGEQLADHIEEHMQHRLKRKKSKKLV